MTLSYCRVLSEINQVTVFGESAGAIMNSILFLNSPLEKLARGAVSSVNSQQFIEVLTKHSYL